MRGTSENPATVRSKLTTVLGALVQSLTGGFDTTLGFDGTVSLAHSCLMENKTVFPIGSGSARPFAAIPRARRLPLLGSIPALLLQRLAFFENARAECGDIFAVDVGVEELVVVSDPAAAEEILVMRSKSFDKGGTFWDGARESFGNGLAFSDGELWRRQRRLMNPQFRKERIAGFHSTITKTVEQHLVELERQCAGGVAVDISRWTATLLQSLTVRLLLGTALPLATSTRLPPAIGVLADKVITGIVTRKLPAWVPVPGASRVAEARKTIDELILAIIRERRAASEPGEDLLGMLLAATDEDGSMSDQQLRDEMVILYIAAVETTAWTLAWGLYCLAEQPTLVGKLQAELSTHHDLALAPLLDATVREVMRLYPSIPFFPRRAVVDEELLGYQILAGTTVVVMPWLIHRNPKFWPDPTRFDPHRHLVPSDRPKLAWMPFAAGQRSCIGQGLAIMEVVVTLGQILRRYTPRPAANHKRSEPRLSSTLAARDGVWIRLQQNT